MSVLTLGTFDCFHVGHVKILQLSATYGQKLVVGVSSDFLNIEKKNKMPVLSIYDRYYLVRHLNNVDQVFIENEYDVNSKYNYMNYYKCEIFVIGDDWKGAFDELVDKFKKKDDRDIQIHYLARTPHISTSVVLSNIHHVDQFDYLKSMLLQPSHKLATINKIQNFKCVLFPRNVNYQALHLLPYYHLFEPENVAWYVDETSDLKTVLNHLKKSLKHLFTNVLLSYEELREFKPNIGILTEMWKPHCDAIHYIGGKILFTDHGICVGTRTPEWFAHSSQDYADYILTAGNMQKDYHQICLDNTACHQRQDLAIEIIGWPRISLTSNLSWIWNMYNVNYQKKILIIPSCWSYSEINNSQLEPFLKLVQDLCHHHKVVIRPHPMSQSISYDDSVLFKLFEHSIEHNYCYNLVIIPPHFNIHTPDLFQDCDLAIFDKSSLGYEFLLADKPGISVGIYQWTIPSIQFLVNGFPHFDSLADITLNRVTEIMQNGYQEQRIKLKQYVFSYIGEEWIDNFKQLLDKIKSSY